MSRAVAIAIVVISACGGSGSPTDPTAKRCAPHRTRELACADAETHKALLLVGDMCQKVLNGKNGHVFGPGDVKRMEAELACAQSNSECDAYRACRDRVTGPTLDER